MRKSFVAVAALVLTGCSSPTPDTRSPSSTSPPASVRPREIKLDGVDPCGLLPDDSVRLAGFGSGPQAEQHPSFQAPSCHFYSSNGTELMVTALPTLGIERFEPSKKTGEARTRSIQGFRSLEIYSSTSCTVVVDVADGQVLHMTFSKKNDPPLPEQVGCRMAVELANIATRTLLTR